MQNYSSNNTTRRDKIEQEGKLDIMREILKSEPSIWTAIAVSDNSINTLPDSMVEEMVLENFKKYDEIFKALAWFICLMVIKMNEYRVKEDATDKIFGFTIQVASGKFTLEEIHAWLRGNIEEV